MAATLARRAAPGDPAARPPQPPDRWALAQLMLDAYRGTVDDEGETLADAQAVLEQFFDGDFGVPMLAVSELIERDGAPVAATLVTLYEGLPFLAFSMTHPRWQRQGLARAGLQRAMARLAAGDETVMRLMVTDGNPAERLYASLGFARVPASPRDEPSALAAPAEVLGFWFGAADAVDARWFGGGPGYDALIAQRFGATLDAALAGSLPHWPAAGTDGALALLIVLDQFTRNAFRGTPRAFAGDAQALALARGLVDRGDDRTLPLLRRWFAYMPFEHAEDLAAQARSVALFEQLLADAADSPHRDEIARALDYARRHEAVVRRFGRFPHRNAILGRASTPAEAGFLQEPGSRF